MATASEEAASVLAWFEFYTRLYEDGARVARPSRTLLQLLQSAFSTLYDDVVARRLMLGAEEWQCVVLLLEAFYEVELGIDRSALHDAMTLEDAALHASCVAILEFTVSALVQSDSKTRFVGDIMTMDDSVQVDIMAVIERTLKHTANLSSNSETSRDDAKESDYDHNTHDGHKRRSQLDLGTPSRSPSRHSYASPSSSSLTSHSPLHLARHAEVERLQRANEILKEDNIHAVKELGEAKQKLHAAESENAMLLQTIDTIKLQADMDLLKKERTVRSYFDERMHSIQRELDRTASELEEKAAIAKDVGELRDEIDLLRPAAEKLAKAEATLVKYKTKIEELTSAKEKLRRVEEANTDLVEKNLSLESQAAKAAALQRKLADCKEANTTIQFHVSELETKLMRLTTELESKRLECETSAAALLEAKLFNRQLQETVDQYIDAKGFTSNPAGLAGGISELNPELMEKLARLEHENATLRSRVDGTTSERIDVLLDEIDDLKRMKKSFETKYFDTNDSLQETQSKLATTEDHVASLELTLLTCNKDIQTTTHERDLLRQTLNLAEQRIRDLSDLIREREEDIQRRAEVEKELHAEISKRSEDHASLKKTLLRTEEKLQLSEERIDLLQEDVCAHTVERSDLVAYRDQLLERIQVLELQCSAGRDRIAELEMELAALIDELAGARSIIVSLEQSDARHDMRCEELEGILGMKTKEVEGQSVHIAHLNERIDVLDRDILDREESNSRAVASIQLLTERLHLTNEDLFVVQQRRATLLGEVERLLDQETRGQEELQESREHHLKTTEDFEQRLLIVQENKSAELEQAATDQERLLASHAIEVQKLSEEAAQSVARMTSVIDDKCSLLQEAKQNMSALREDHQQQLDEVRRQYLEEKTALHAQKDSIATKFAAYVSHHSFTNEYVSSKEAALEKNLSEATAQFVAEKAKLSQQRDSVSAQMKRLQDANQEMKLRFDGQESKLRNAVKSQLEANRKLVEVNQAVKSELAKKEAQVVQLENAITRLDSRLLIFERERTHYSSEEGKKRDTDDSSSSYSSQLSSHVSQIMEELDTLRKEHRQLQEQLAYRETGRTNGQDESTPQNTKTFLMERIRQLELAKAQEEDKKRELLLVNAKLIQDQKQVQFRTASDSREVQLLKEKVNTWMLRDERRKKEHEAFAQRVQDLEYQNKRLQSMLVNDASEMLTDPASQSSQDSLQPVAPLKSAGSDDQENIPPHENAPIPSNESRKRKLEEARSDEVEALANRQQLSLDPEPVVDKLCDVRGDVPQPVDNSGVLVATAPRAKRRMSHFISSRLTTSSTQDDEKPSECHQQ